MKLSLLSNLLLSAALLATAVTVFVLQRRARSGGGQKPLSAELQSHLAPVERAAEGLLRGDELSDAALSECGAAHDRIYDGLCRRNGTTDNTEFSPADGERFYLHCIKLAALGHPDHGAWPLKARLRTHLAPSLVRKADTAQDPWLRLAAIPPALLVQDVEAAARLYRTLPPVLARLALQWVTETTIGHQPFNHVPSSQAWLRAVAAPAPAAPAPERDPLTREQRWALSVSVTPSYAFDSRATLGEPLPPAAARLALLRDWEIDDAESALDTLQWLLDEGHRAQLAQELANPDGLDQKKHAFLRESLTLLRAYGMAAIDLCHTIDISRSAHTAGYLDEPTAWHFVLSAARKLQTSYPSWLAMSDDYLLGVRYLADGEPADPTLLAYIDWMRHAPSSPWQTIAWSASGDA